MAFILKSIDNGEDDIIALHKSVDELKEDVRTTDINKDEYVINFNGSNYIFIECDTVTFEHK